MRSFLVVLVLALAACSDSGGPSGPDGALPDGVSRIAGQFTAGANAAAGGRALGPAADDPLAGVTVTVKDGLGNTIFSTTTDLEGEFQGTVPPGTYTVIVEVDPENQFSFSFDVPAGTSFFVDGKIDTNPSGKFKLDAEIFIDNNGDGEPDSSFRIRITGRLAGLPQSGDVDVIGAGEKVALCHFPPGNPDNFHTIVVGPDAVESHLAHGDTEGPCDDDDLNPVDDDQDDDGLDEEDDGEKVTICHIPPGNPENARTIEVGEDAVEAHLAHGDTEGECQGGAVARGAS